MMNEYQKWINGEYPYDAAECGVCATLHAFGLCHQHPEMIAAAKELSLVGPQILAFRKKFARFYPTSTKVTR